MISISPAAAASENAVFPWLSLKARIAAAVLAFTLEFEDEDGLMRRVKVAGSRRRMDVIIFSKSSSLSVVVVVVVAAVVVDMFVGII